MPQILLWQIYDFWTDEKMILTQIISIQLGPTYSKNEQLLQTVWKQVSVRPHVKSIPLCVNVQ